MFEVQEKPNKVERAFLVRFYFDRREKEDSLSLLSELKGLVEALEIPAIGTENIYVRDENRKYISGIGKAEEIAEKLRSLKSDCLIIDNSLSPSQQRAWEKLTEVCVIDREEVILDIFAQRAKTKEAQLQVELAQERYSLPRLARMWSHLDRQKGGAGLRGDGEQQIEVDRRLAREKIQRCERELEKVIKQRKTQSKERKQKGIPQVSIIGYTNAGKSSLLNHLSGSEILVKDALFATLDSTTKRVSLTGGEFLLSDTVGFIRQLPHHLIAAFRSTLENALDADLLIHLLDASHPEVKSFYEATMQVLRDLKAEEKEMLLVFNKIDKISSERKADLKADFPNAHFLSVFSEEGIEDLLKKCTEIVFSHLNIAHYRIPQAEAKLLQQIQLKGKILSLEYEGNWVKMKAIVPPLLVKILKPFLVR